MLQLNLRGLTFGTLAAAVILAAGTAAAPAQSGGTFGNIAGNWSGGGTIAMNDGHNERLRCRANYEVSPSGVFMHQELRCASDSYKFEVSSSIQANGNALSGTWTEKTRQVSGNVSGTIQGDTISTSVNGGLFSAQLGVRTQGNSQSVSITPDGTDIKSVQINLKRG